MTLATTLDGILAAMEGSGEGGAVTLGDCQRALKNEVLHDLLKFVIRRILGDEGSLTADKRAQIGEFMRELVG